MLEIIKQEINMSNELESKIKWCLNYSNVKYKIYNGQLRIIKNTNLAYVEPHRVIINNTLYLFFNEQDFFYVGDLTNKYPLSKLQEHMGNLSQTLNFWTLSVLYSEGVLNFFKKFMSRHPTNRL